MSAPVPDAPERPAAFVAWIAAFRTEALAQGISAETFDDVFADVRFNQRVVELDEDQPEFNRAIWDYLDRAVNEDRIDEGKRLLRKHRRAFRAVQRQYGVPPTIIAGIWGMESNFGKLTGGFNVIEALATLAYQGRRAAFFRVELMAALKIIEDGDIDPERMTGSWAGAMGQTQFMPTVFLRYARDGNRDGKRDLWDTLSDVFASTANYLKEKGWQKGQPCFDEVELPDDFEYADADLSVRRPVKEWRKAGVVRVDGRNLSRSLAEESASLIVPAGHDGPAFIVYPNFRVVQAYNPPISYALAVCQLAKRFEGGRPIKTPWPRDETPLSKALRLELQALLAKRGFEIGEHDGEIGPVTRAAIRQFQKAEGLAQDGFATLTLLQRLRRPIAATP
jgi:lytic murein transglycosylase